MSATAGRIAIRVIPRSPRDEVSGERDGRLLVRVRAAPVDGRANNAVRAVIAAHLGLRASSVTIVSGERSRDKVVQIAR